MRILAPALVLLTLVAGVRAEDDEGDPPRRRARPPAATAGVTREVADANRDGVVGLGEWVELFAAADEDGDRCLSAEEWRALLEPPSRLGGRAPAVGSKAPAVKATPLAGGEPVDLARPERTTVLVFGSWT